MTKHNFPSFIDWTYTKWYFWVTVSLYALWSGADEILNSNIYGFIGTIIAVIFIVSLFFLFSYLMAKSYFKKLKHN